MDESIEIVPIQFEKILQSRAYSCVVLGSNDKKFAIYTDPISGRSIQTFLASTHKSRPSTHDFMNFIFRGYEITVKHIIIYDLKDTIYFCRIFLEQKMETFIHIVEIDIRPSDGITLALLHKAPIYCALTVLESAIAYLEN